MTPYYSDDAVTLYQGDALVTLGALPGESVDCIVTSPPYFGLRDYGMPGQYGLEPSPAAYVETMRQVFAESRRVLAKDGTLWLNIGDSYVGNGSLGRNDAGRNFTGGGGNRLGSGNPGRQGSFSVAHNLPSKNLLGIPWRVAFALQDDGWTLRNAIVWHKPNAMPESVTDRLSNRYEPVFLFSKSRRYWFDLDPIRETYAYPEDVRVLPRSDRAEPAGQQPQRRRMGNRYGMTRPGVNREQGDNHDAADPRGRNPGDVWTITTRPFSEAHFACMPAALAERCIKAGCKPGGTVLDPFSGSGTTGLAATKLGRRYVGIDLNRDYLDLSLRTRLAQTALLDGEAS